jgi:signal transduction histidine kinase/DNA-binding response OmpR family regulator/ligand-binding sensor domain-containing protein
MRRQFQLLVAFLLVTTGGPTHGHAEFQRPSVSDGLAQSSIAGMLQDREGFLWFGTQYGLSRYDGYRFQNFSARSDDLNSLSDSKISDLALARNGDLWVGTRDGLNRFDPLSGLAQRYFLVHQNVESEADSPIRHTGSTEISQIMGETGSGRIFVRLEDQIAVLEPEASSLELLPFEIPLSELGRTNMWGLLDSSDRLWVVNDAGIWRLDPTNDVLRRIDGLRPARDRAVMASLAETAEGQIAVVVESGLILFEPEQDRASRLISPAEFGWTDHSIDAVSASASGSLWIAAGARIARFRFESGGLELLDQVTTQTSDPSAPTHLQAVSVGDQGDWLATQYGVSYWPVRDLDVQFFIHDPRDDQSLPPTLLSMPYSLFVDRDQTLWIGSQLGGLARLPYHLRRFDHLVDQSPPGALPFAGQNVVRGVVETRINGVEDVWLALESAGLRQYRRRASGQYELLRVFHSEADAPQRLPGNEVWAMALDPRSDRIWIGQDQRLVIIDAQRGEVIDDDVLDSDPSIREISSLLFSEDGERLWVGHAAVNEFHVQADRLSLSDCPNGAFLPRLGQFNLLELDDGRLVVGGRDGFSLVDFHGGQSSMILRDQTFLTPGVQEIYGLARHHEEGFWIGTRQAGLAHVELRSGTAAPALSWFDSATGLVDDTIYAIVPEPSGRLWLSSNQGLMRFDPERGDLRHFTPPDGVQHFEFNNTVGHRGVTGRIYFGGINGANAFQPGDIRILQEAPRLRLSELRINGQTLATVMETPKAITLDHDENDLEVSFVGLHSAHPERHRYQHRLEGLDEDWREVGFQRQVRYGGLPAGDYRLWARAANSDGVWSEDVLLLTASIRPPPWASVWAYIAYLLVTLAVMALFWFQTRQRQHRLEEEVMQRTSELTRQQVLIRQQAEELKRALKSRTAFFANVSHEFRTPLTLIGASLDDLNRRLPDAPPLIRARSYLDRLVRLVDQLLNLSELQAEKVHEPGSPWSISSVLGFMIRSFEPLARQRGIRFSSHIQDHCLTACSQHHVEQVALNLISNALKYSPSGESVSVTLQAGPEGLLLSVDDTGPGIDPAEQEAVFERFHRAEDARNSGQAGAGIGLALVRETVEALGGTIELESALDRGSSFRVTLPGEYVPDLSIHSMSLDQKALDLEVSQLVPLPPPANLGLTAQNEASGLLLIVEDQPEIRSYLAESLGDEWRVIEAADGQQGLQRARQDLPDLVLSDVMLPGMDGFQMLARLRDDLATSHIPVLLLTARHDRDSRMKGLMLSADDFLGKPFDIAELRVRLRRMRDNRRRMQRYLLDRGAEGTAPDAPGQLPDLSARDLALLESLQDWLGQVLDDASITVEDMAAAVAMETRTLQRKLRALTGQTPSEFIRHFRLQQAIELLLGTDRSVHDIALSCGFSNPQSFSRAFSREYGQPPDRWRRNRGAADHSPK